MMDEMARVLRPGGRLVIGELHKWSGWAAQRRLRPWFGSTLWRQGRFRTAGELNRLAREMGLEVEALRGAVYYPRLTMAARLLAPHDGIFARVTNLGAPNKLRARRLYRGQRTVSSPLVRSGSEGDLPGICLQYRSMPMTSPSGLAVSLVIQLRHIST